MTTLREAAQQALEAMESADVDPHSSDAVYKAITDLRAALVEDAMQKFTDVNQELEAALAEHYCDTHCTWADHAPGCVRAEPVQEPVAWYHVHCPNCASLQDQNTELDKKLAEMERKLLELQAAVLQSQGIRSGDA